MARTKTSTVTIAPTAPRGRSRTTVKRRVIVGDPEDPLELAVVAPPPPLPPVPVINHVVVQPAPMEVDRTSPACDATE
jgi:hypothetical protein